VTARVRFKMLLTMVRPTPRAGPDSSR